MTKREIFLKVRTLDTLAATPRAEWEALLAAMGHDDVDRMMELADARAELEADLARDAERDLWVR